jgi:hypothetical protein
MRCVELLAAAALAWATSAACMAQKVELGGQVRLQWTEQTASNLGPLALANVVKTGTVADPDSGATLETELRASGHGITGVATLQQSRWRDRTSDGQGWVNELYAAHDGGAWQFSAGKKIVAWDVGYGFRPNDMVQQEERLGLVTSTAQGRPVLMAEHFTADTAWSLVALHPTGSPQDRGVLEPALAGRVYQRNGALDSYGFARLGARNGASVGAALAWVAGDALELHGSLRYLSRADSKAINPATNGLVTSNPWRSGMVDDVTQLLLGGTWTHESQLSLLAEAWWDGSAMSDAQWDAWGQRNTQLTNLSALGAPASAVAGNLAWQADAFGVSPSLRRNNVLMRVSWQNGPWTPTLDVLYSPADQGRVVTAALSWQGDRVQVQGGVRTFGGPDHAVAAQLAARNVAYITTTWTF